MLRSFALWFLARRCSADPSQRRKVLLDADERRRQLSGLLLRFLAAES
jgi:hypothetical protein